MGLMTAGAIVAPSRVSPYQKSSQEREARPETLNIEHQKSANTEERSDALNTDHDASAEPDVET